MHHASQSLPSAATTVENNITPLILGSRPEPPAARICPVLRPVSIREGLDTVNEFCAFFRISRTTFYKLKNQGLIRPVKIGRRTLVPRSEHAEWIYRMPQPALFPQAELIG
jgi:excisionase family DNA binding protein